MCIFNYLKWNLFSIINSFTCEGNIKIKPVRTFSDMILTWIEWFIRKGVHVVLVKYFWEFQFNTDIVVLFIAFQSPEYFLPKCPHNPLKIYFIERERQKKRVHECQWKEGQQEKEKENLKQTSSELRAWCGAWSHDLRSWLELKSRVWCLADWATQVPPYNRVLICW